MKNLLSFPLDCTKDFKLLNSPTDEQVQDICTTIRERVVKNTLVHSDPRVSVIFPAYNEEMYLIIMLWTLSQLDTRIPIEIIWVNNASTDRTGEIIEQCWIIRVDEKRKWVSYARQAGLEVAKWEYIGTTDADTQVPPDWIDANIKYFEEDPHLACFSWESTMNNFHSSRDIIFWLLRPGARLVRYILWINRELTIDHEKHFDAFSGHNMFFKKKDALLIGGYQAWFDLWEDALIAHKLWSLGKTFTLNTDPWAHVQTSSRRVSNLEWILEMSLNGFRSGSWRHRISRQHVPDKPVTFRDVR
jgi:glycosyltransferase involved in cell wall biosynthesis